MENQALSDSDSSACTNACTSDAEKRQDADTSADAGQLAGAELAKALAMIAELPLLASERAEAVRRLLAER